MTLVVQPYEKTKTQILFNGESIKFNIIYTDKSLSILEFVCNINQTAKTLEVRHPKFETKTFELTTNKTSVKLFAILDKPNSTLSFQNLCKTNGTPKSVRFIDDETIVVTLLSGRGFNLINLRTGKTKLVCPPEKYAKQEGFVESLYLKHKNELWISQMTTDCMHIFSVPDFEYLDTVQCSGSWGKVMAYNKAENAVYFTNWISKDISIVDVNTRKEKAIRKIGAVPRGLAFSDDGKFAYFAQFETANGSYGGKTLRVRLSDFATLSKLGKPGAKRHIVKDNSRLYVSDMSRCTVEVFSLIDEKQLAEIPVGDNPNTIVLSPDTKKLYVSCRGKNHPTKGYLHKGLVFGRLYIIDTEKLTVVESIEGGNQPTGLDISPDGKTLVFSDFLDNVVRIYKIKN